MINSWVIIAIFTLLILLAVIAIIITRKYKRPTDYHTLFIVGILWVVIGLPTQNTILSLVGFICLVMGLMHKDKWKKNKTNYKKLKMPEKIISGIIIAFLLFLLIAGIVLFYLN